MKKINKRLTKAFISVFLACAMGVFPAFALGEGGADSDASENTMQKFTPVIDGVIDEEYRSSFCIEHEFPSSDDLDIVEKQYNYYNKDGILFVKEGKYEYGYREGDKVYDPVEYRFDIDATTYIVYDDENIYIAVEVTDDDYGCLPEENYQYAEDHIIKYEKGPIYQDGVGFGLSFGESKLLVFCSRDGKAIAPNFGSFFMPARIQVYSYDGYLEEQHEISWVEIDPWLERENNVGKTYYEVCETDGGYIIEACLKMNEAVRDEILSADGGFGFGLLVCDAGEDSDILHHSDISMYDCYCLTHLLSDFVCLYENGYVGDQKLPYKVMTYDANAEKPAEEPNEPEKTTDETTASAENGEKPSAPETGDGVALLVCVLLGASAACLAVLCGKRRERSV